MDLNKIKYFTILNALAAGLGYGGWAAYANHGHGLRVAMIAGIVQGVYAFGLTGCITQVARWGFRKYSGGIRGGLAGFGMSFSIMLTVPLVIHYVAGTPEVGQTILPGLILGSIYLIGYLGINCTLRV